MWTALTALCVATAALLANVATLRGRLAEAERLTRLALLEASQANRTAGVLLEAVIDLIKTERAMELERTLKMTLKKPGAAAPANEKES